METNGKRLIVSRHAVERYVERAAPWATPEEAEEAIREAFLWGSTPVAGVGLGLHLLGVSGERVLLGAVRRGVLTTVFSTPRTTTWYARAGQRKRGLRGWLLARAVNLAVEAAEHPHARSWLGWNTVVTARTTTDPETYRDCLEAMGDGS